MKISRILGLLVATLLLIPSTAKAADDGGLALPWASLLPALPLPYQPPTEPILCADGALSCVDDTIANMSSRLQKLEANCAHEAVFQLMYLRVSEEVKRSLVAKKFIFPDWTSTEVTEFADVYFKFFDAYQSAGDTANIPTAWKIALGAAKRHEVSALGNFALSMNAHVNGDMPFVLAKIGLVSPEGKSRKIDHDIFNARLATLYNPVTSEIAAKYDPTMTSINVGNFDDIFGKQLIQTWREAVWRNAERLVLAKTPLQRKLVSDSIHAYATTQANLYYQIFRNTKAQTQARDAYCASRKLG